MLTLLTGCEQYAVKLEIRMRCAHITCLSMAKSKVFKGCVAGNGRLMRGSQEHIYNN